VNDQLGTCAADGQSLSQVNEDCISGGKTCSLEGMCRPYAGDEIGVGDANSVSDQNPEGTLVANVITVHTSRRLVVLQTFIPPKSPPPQLRWLVYEQIGNAFVAKVDVVVTNAQDLKNGVADVDQFPLEPGKTYLFGRVLSAADSTLNTPVSSMPRLSFGSVVGRLSLPSAPSSIDIAALAGLQTDVVSFMRMDTLPP